MIAHVFLLSVAALSAASQEINYLRRGVPFIDHAEKPSPN